MNVDDIKILITEFESLPKSIPEPTYLEICRHPFQRFEEISSRLLCFFLNPKEQHGLKNLFLNSFLDLIEPGLSTELQYDGLSIYSEVITQTGQRLDIMIRSKSFIIGVENKISAGLYNPLDTYKELLKVHSINNEKLYNIVLSIKKIEKESEKQWMDKNEFKNITYNEYITKVRDNLGLYISGCNTKYLIYANDFLQTLENMDNQNIVNPQLDNFFYENQKRVEELVSMYTEFDKRILEFQKKQIVSIHEQLLINTGDTKWWLYEGWDLGYNEFLGKKNQIGIESNYSLYNRNPCGKYKIFITGWNAKTWKLYEAKLKSKLPGEKIEKEDNIQFIQYAVIDGDNQSLIIETLIEAQIYVKGLIEGNK